MNVVIKNYPYNKDCALALTIDDLHPESKSELEGKDFGMDVGGEFWSRMIELKQVLPEIKPTIFTVANWIDRSDWPDGHLWIFRKICRRKRSYPVNRFSLQNELFKTWLKKVGLMVKSLDGEIALHGLYHHNDAGGFPSSQEFIGINKQEKSKRVDEMFRIFRTSGLSFSSGFRPPGWGIGTQLVDILKDKVKYLAASSDFVSPVKKNLANGAGIKDVPLYQTSDVGGVLNFVANCYPEQTQRAVEIAALGGIIVVHAHIACTVSGLKFVDAHFVRNIQKISEEIKNQTMKRIWFATLSEIVDFTSQIKQVSYKVVSRNKIEFANHGNVRVDGLTVNINNQNYVLDSIAPKKKVIFEIDKHKLEKRKVTAVLTVYNGEKNVIQSLESLCNQTYRNLEIIVVNDGSTDNTSLVLKNYVRSSGDKRITLVNQKNGGRSVARNRGFSESSGDIVTFCEDDAIYDKDYIENGTKHFSSANTKLGGVIGPHYVWNKYQSFNTRAKDIERRRNFHSYKPNSCWFYSREVFTKLGGFNNGLNLVEDVEPAIRLKKMGYHFIYERNCRWLHKEPANLKQYLRRKYRGGVGMALLVKSGLKGRIITWRGIFLLLWSLVLLIVSVENLSLSRSVYPLTLFLGLFLFRLSDLVVSVKVSNEPLIFTVIAVYYEYIWWTATLIGYLFGMRMNAGSINRYLKNR